MKAIISFIVILSMLFSTILIVQADSTPSTQMPIANTASPKPTEIYVDTDGTVYTTDSELGDGGNISRRTAEGGYELVEKGMTSAFTFILQDGVFYFGGTDLGGFMQLHSMNKDGSGKKKLSDEYLSTYTVTPTKIYLSSLGNPGIYEMNLDGTGVKKISEDVADTLVYYDNKLYYNVPRWVEPIYMKAVSAGELKVLDLKTLQSSVLYHGKASNVDVYNGYVYFSNVNDAFALYRIRIADTSIEKLAIKTFDYVFKDNLIYYSDAERLVPADFTLEYKLPCLSKASIDGTNVVQLTNYPARRLSVSGDFIIFHEYMDYELFSLSLRRIINIKTLPDIKPLETRGWDKGTGTLPH